MLWLWRSKSPRDFSSSAQPARKKRERNGVAEFLRHHRTSLALNGRCRRCQGPVAASMRGCPWCGNELPKPRVKKRDFPSRCRRCGRGRKLDWRYCGWCHGPGFVRVANREYTDVRYEGRCANPRRLSGESTEEGS